jgi:hypothetical protein
MLGLYGHRAMRVKITRINRLPVLQRAEGLADDDAPKPLLEVVDVHR